MKLILATVALVTVLASPASAQAFWVGDGTGNVLPFSYGPGGTRHGPGDPLTINPQSDQLALVRVGYTHSPESRAFVRSSASSSHQPRWTYRRDGKLLSFPSS